MHLLEMLARYSIGAYLLWLVGVWLRDEWLLGYAMRRTDEQAKSSDPAEQAAAQRILERIVRVPCIGGEKRKFAPRYRLGCLYANARRYEEAVTQFQMALKILEGIKRHPVEPGIAAEIYQRLADCYEALGDNAQATTARQQAAQCLDNSSGDRFALGSQGRMLASQRRYQEAYAAYERALALTPDGCQEERVLMMLKLQNTAYEAGRPDLAAHWTEQPVTQPTSVEWLIMAHTMGGVAYGVLGDLATSERHRRRAYELAGATGNRKLAAEKLSHLAGILRKRGKLEEALEQCDRAMTMTSEAVRHVAVERSDCLRSMGRFEEAIQALQQARDAAPLPTPAAARRMQAVLSLGMAWTVADAGQLDAAWDHLQQAVSLQQDKRLGLWHLATESRVLAQLGRYQEARYKAEQVEAQLSQFAEDRETLLTTRMSLARATFLCGDYTHSLELLQHYFDLKPDPVMQPQAWYFKGENQRALGDGIAAKAAYEQAVSLGLNTYYSRLAQERLSGI